MHKTTINIIYQVYVTTAQLQDAVRHSLDVAHRDPTALQSVENVRHAQTLLLVRAKVQITHLQIENIRPRTRGFIARVRTHNNRPTEHRCFIHVDENVNEKEKEKKRHSNFKMRCPSKQLNEAQQHSSKASKAAQSKQKEAKAASGDLFPHDVDSCQDLGPVPTN